MTDIIEEPNFESTESRGMHHFDRMGRPVTVFDQRSNQNTSIMLEWTKHVEIWQKNQVPHNIS